MRVGARACVCESEEEGGGRDLNRAVHLQSLKWRQVCGGLVLFFPGFGLVYESRWRPWAQGVVVAFDGDISSFFILLDVTFRFDRCVEKNHRAGVQALFVVFGCFAEDEVGCVRITLAILAFARRFFIGLRCEKQQPTRIYSNGT